MCLRLCFYDFEGADQECDVPRLRTAVDKYGPALRNVYLAYFCPEEMTRYDMDTGIAIDEASRSFHNLESLVLSSAMGKKTPKFPAR